MVALLVLEGCTSGSGGASVGLGTGVLGQACQKTEDCASGLCVRVNAQGGVCTTACSSDMNCPAADNWACLTSDDGTNIKLCACRKLADTEVCGDGVDNDCNGNVDDCRVCNGLTVPNDDPSNCGACGNACLPGQSCDSGKCSCPETAAAVCASGCADLSRDPQNCGACGTDCGAGRACTDGVCQCTDAVKTSFCAGAGCVSLADDSQNCGACGVACIQAQVCKSGACACPSSSAPDFCASVGCIDEKTDAQNCGSCGTHCAAGQV
ncbi:MAG TPA: hypothetical protein VNW92_15645, partial [Polyangiaceae bacterium]|nr:hypothetical protein [Polyangiaceae bacterium]